MKKHIILLLKTLINNNACVESARTKEKKYNIIAVVIAIVGLFLSVLPIGVTKFNTKGSAWMKSNNYNYGLDLGFQGFMDSVKDHAPGSTVEPDPEKQYSFTFSKTDKNETCLNISQTNWDNAYKPAVGEGAYQFYSYSDPESAGSEKTERFRAYVVTDKDLSTAIKEISSNCSCTFIVFGKTKVYAYLYQPGVTAKNAFVGDYHHVNVDNLLKYRVENKPQETYNNWVKFFDDAYLDIRWSNGWVQIGIMCGVNGGVIILMGFMVWILTRGKNNPYRIYSFWDGQKISYYASFTPALLSLIGFAIPLMSQMLFALTLGIRVMWLSMRTLRYNAPMKK